VASGAALFAQAVPAEHFIADELRPYYAHTGFSWKIDSISHFELNYESDTEAARRITQLEEVALRARSSILKMLGEPDYQPTVHVFFVESVERMKQLIGSEVIGRSRPTQHAVFCVVAPFSELSLKHELTHEIATNLWGPAEQWMEEGMANFAVDNKSSLMKRQCLAMMQSRQWTPLKKLVNAEWESSSLSPDEAYPELGGFIEYLYETYGVARLQKIWKDGRILREKDSYAGWAEQVAEAEGAPFLDLNELAARRYEELGPQKTEALFGDPHTHTSPAGAEVNASCVVAALKALKDDPLAPYFSEKARDVPPAGDP